MIRRLALSLLPLAAVFAVAAPSAQAGLLTVAPESCENPDFEKPFLPWLDPANYVKAPDGTIEAGAAGWQLDGAEVVAGNEPFYVNSTADSKSLRISSGGSATSPAMCVGIEHPTLRFFVKRQGGTVLSNLRVDLLYNNHLGQLETLPAVGAVTGTSSWAPTAQMVIPVSLLPLLPGDHTPVAFRFVPQGSGSWQIDDVYVDPYTRR
jgi:hypothetical protein